MVQEFHVLRCSFCEVFQVQQVKKVNKWSCKVCGQKQSVIKEFGRGSGADCRRHVQKLNAVRGAKMEEDAEHRAKMDSQSLWRGTDEEEQLWNKPVSRWDKYLNVTQEEAEITPEEGDPEESAVVMDRDLLSFNKQRVKKRELNSPPPQKRRKTNPDVSGGRSPYRGAPAQSPSPPKAAPSLAPPRAVSRWSTFLNQPPASDHGSGSSASALFQSGEDLDLSWSEDCDWT